MRIKTLLPFLRQAGSFSAVAVIDPAIAHPMPSNHLSTILALLGIEPRPASHHERWLSMAGGLLGIALIFTAAAFGPAGVSSTLVVASMGASAVLVFAVPHGALSQPWPVLGGHLISAFVGVSAGLLVPLPALAGPLAVGVAILAMHYTRCLHPPGGATALAAVIGGDAITSLGYGYLLAPVLSNVMLLLVAGIAFNYPFRWRRYPAALARPLTRTAAPETMPSAEPPAPTLSHADLVYALSEIDSFIDVSEGDLLRIYELATLHATEEHLPPDAIQPARCYSNGRFGADWAVRCVVEVVGGAADDQVLYRGVAGADRRRSGTLPKADFARWARYEVERDETTWRPVER
jgi:CBS-domain-containing membrane protein